MQKFIESGLFRLLTGPPQNEVSSSQLEELYDDFALILLARLQSEQNHAELFFVLGFVHSKLAGICEGLSDREEKKCPENSCYSYVSDKIGYAGIGMAYHSTNEQN